MDIHAHGMFTHMAFHPYETFTHMGVSLRECERVLGLRALVVQIDPKILIHILSEYPIKMLWSRSAVDIGLPSQSSAIRVLAPHCLM